jgi:DNA-binding transcriptional regulator YiaG
MEEDAVYNSEPIRKICLVNAKDWEEPTGSEIRAALQSACWSGEEFSRRVSVDGRTVRRWVLDEKKIPYAAWCVLCVEAGLGKIWK